MLTKYNLLDEVEYTVSGYIENTSVSGKKRGIITSIQIEPETTTHGWAMPNKYLFYYTVKDTLMQNIDKPKMLLENKLTLIKKYQE